MASFNTAFEARNMSTSQRQAIIILIDKKDKDRSLRNNWRPISLLNTDCLKFFSNALAFRINKVLPNIIHHNQSGYVEGRYIGEIIRTIYVLWILQRVKARAASLRKLSTVLSGTLFTDVWRCLVLDLTL